MGRPLNKRYFTDAVTGATAGADEIKVNFHNGTAVKEGTIVRQKGSKRFVVAETGAADTEFTCYLKTGVLPAALAAGEMSISVLGSDAEVYGVSKIAGRKVTLVAPSATGTNALDGLTQGWQMGAAASSGTVRVEEAGDDDVANTDDDDFTDDA
ncbi:uncharacterized protein METZ01_LOCUS91014 [marine metagenome]|jgi:hypothetical protein|uniref:Uncharacterized protein n=1 Tax=marine metagenome TaxID=408172 RepID=A0A381VCR4_9ZZZZ|tara:strand:- start:3886 stop:4347 length:462 start_codon:yes stop_codon:yes gene_type:complete